MIIKKGITTPDSDSKKPIRIKLQGRMIISRASHSQKPLLLNDLTWSTYVEPMRKLQDWRFHYLTDGIVLS